MTHSAPSSRRRQLVPRGPVAISQLFTGSWLTGKFFFGKTNNSHFTTSGFADITTGPLGYLQSQHTAGGGGRWLGIDWLGYRDPRLGSMDSCLLALRASCIEYRQGASIPSLHRCRDPGPPPILGLSFPTGTKLGR